MVPPALLKIVEHIPQWIFNGLEADRGKHKQLKITDYDSLGKPTQKMTKSEDVKAFYHVLREWSLAIKEVARLYKSTVDGGVERTFSFTAYLRQTEDESSLEVVLYDKMKRNGVYFIIELNIINTVCVNLHRSARQRSKPSSMHMGDNFLKKLNLPIIAQTAARSFLLWKSLHFLLCKV